MLKWILVLFVVLGGVGVISYLVVPKAIGATSPSTSGDTSPSSSSTVNEWTSQSPQRILDDNTANNDINNIHTLQKDGWKILIQNGQPVSYNSKISGRNQIIEQSFTDLLNGCYGISLDADGNVVDIKLSDKAKSLYQQNQTQQVQQQQQSAHDSKVSIIQNNISDINDKTDQGYRIKITDASAGNVKSWNINSQTDNSPRLESAVSRLAEFGISVHTDGNGKVIGFGFDNSGFSPTEFNLYGMTN